MQILRSNLTHAVGSKHDHQASKASGKSVANGAQAARAIYAMLIVIVTVTGHTTVTRLAPQNYCTQN